MTTPSELSRLQQAVRESRVDISREYSGLLHELDFRRRFTDSVKRHPLGWIGGAVSAGIVASLFGTGGRKKSPVSVAPKTGSTSSLPARAGWITGAIEIGRILYPVLRPVVTELLGNVARSSLARRGRLG